MRGGSLNQTALCACSWLRGVARALFVYSACMRGPRAGLCGGNGVTPGGNIGKDCAIFEQVRPWLQDGHGYPQQCLRAAAITHRCTVLHAGSRWASGPTTLTHARGTRHDHEQGARAVSNDIAGQGVANPTALTLSTSMMLRHLGLHSFSDRRAKNGEMISPKH